MSCRNNGYLAYEGLIWACRKVYLLYKGFLSE
ncbi:hypothetical protein F7D08_1187 [Bifidobacterium cebidarum]|uniref:Uncharacterized protein n=1 Tax=Bifidobacterium cebidarum TaxID=2650773 RepID=A0A6I1G9F3_9BIFI|nr:hypothetical protein F7D08_1187 [Bifidobacterium cebidarum]